MIEGTIVSMGGMQWVVPPLSLFQLKTYLPRVNELAGLGAAEIADQQLQTLVEIVTAALQRNYPEVTRAQVENILDLGNALPVLNAILGNLPLPEARAQPAAVEFLPDPFPGMEPLPEAPTAAPATVPPSGPTGAPYETATQWPHLPPASS